MAKVRTHKAEVDRLNKHLSPAQIRANKCERCKQRNKAKAIQKWMDAVDHSNIWTELTPAQQLAELNSRPGESRQQRERIATHG